MDSGPLDVFGQMALDEALAQSQPPDFCLRFYKWQGIGATFGYAQRFREVAETLPDGAGQRVTRRLTGGGVVPHVDDLTFSCVFPLPGPWRPAPLYSRLHAAILTGLRDKLRLEAWLCERGGRAAPSNAQGGAMQCFAEPVAQDIMGPTGKILGGAIRRLGGTILYQGSLQLSGARGNPEMAGAIADGLAQKWPLRFQAQSFAPAILESARRLAGKYRDLEWIQRR